MKKLTFGNRGFMNDRNFPWLATGYLKQWGFQRGAT